MSDRNLRALDMRHTLPNLKNLLLTLSDEEGAQSSITGWNCLVSRSVTWLTSRCAQLSYIKSGTSLWTPFPSHPWYPTLLNVRTVRYYSCDDRWKIKTTMMDVSLMISDITNFRMNNFALDASFFPHSDVMTRYDHVFYVARYKAWLLWRALWPHADWISIRAIWS